MTAPSGAAIGGPYVLVWDLETVPDIAAVSRINGRDMSEAEVEEYLGDKFPALPLHKIVCIGALIAQRGPQGWVVQSLGAPHIGQRPEPELIAAFVERIASLRPKLVSFNGHSFDLPVLRYRAMINSVAAPGLEARGYFKRYSDEAVDLCDVLASFDGRAKMSLDKMCRVLGLPGKPDNIEGSQVASFVKDGRIQEVADYCETDVVNTYRVWLRYELFRGGLTSAEFEASEAALRDFVQAKAAERPHLAYLAGGH
ncbi:MAG: 3'-5' exonuclease [Alphaproteobacteria bacterium]|nr:3'-5' exonuclease [Alphaproteobacteria bacterium]